MKLSSLHFLKKISDVFADSEKRRKLGRIAGVFYGCIVLAVLAAMVQVLKSGPEFEKGQSAVVDTKQVQGITQVAISIPKTINNNRASIVKPVELNIVAEPSWQKHAARWAETEAPKIAIVIDDLGLDEEASSQIATISGPFTLAYLPYAEELKGQTEIVHSAGHELIVHLPMQPHSNAADPGPNALLTDLKSQEFERRLDWNLHQFNGFVGVNNHMGSKLTEDAGLMVRVMMHLRKNGWVFLDSLTSPKTVAARAAKATGVPTISRDIFLDNERNESAILIQLEKAEKLAIKRGYAIAIGHPYPETLSVLKQWVKTAKNRGFVLVPISQLIAEKEKGAKQLADASK